MPRVVRFHMTQCFIWSHRLAVRIEDFQSFDTGSNPVGTTNFGDMAERLVRFPHKKEYIGSNPIITTKFRELA